MTKITTEKTKEMLQNVIVGTLETSITNFMSEVITKDDQIFFTIDITGYKRNLKDFEEAIQEAKKVLNEISSIKKTNISITSDSTEKIRLPRIKKIITIASGKGGVGKSTLSVNLAAQLSALGYKVSLLDADIYGPSIPRMMGVKSMPHYDDAIIPIRKYNIDLMSIGFLIDKNEPIIWRGPMITKGLHQLLCTTKWQESDFLIIDTPPGTGDVHLSLTQNYHIDASIIISTPQSIATDDSLKSIAMYNKLGIKIIGIVENMSYMLKDETNPQEKLYPFGEGGGEKLASQFSLKLLDKLPLSPNLCKETDSGHLFSIKYPENSLSLKYKKIAQQIAQHFG